MTTYYQDETVRITSSSVEVPGGTYHLDDLDRVRHDGVVRGVRAWAYWLGRGVAVLALLALVPGLIVGLVIAVRETGSTADRITAIGVVLGVGAALAKGLFEFGVEGYRTDVYGVRQILARWGGEDVVLVRRTDLVTFGQIHRALRRALRSLPSRGGP